MTNIRERASRSVTALVDLIDMNIASGAWQPGTKVPTERELEVEFNVSRNTLRKGLRHLEDAGKIVRQVGRGSFVAANAPKTKELRSAVDHPAPIAPPSIEASQSIDLLRQIQGSSPVDIMEVRLIIEPAVVELAAHRASAADLSQLENCIRQMDMAADIPEYEYWDGMFHMGIVSCAKNDLLATLYKAVNNTRNQREWESLKKRAVTPERRARYHEQHRQILAALCNRDAPNAREMMTEHLRMVRDNLLST